MDARLPEFDPPKLRSSGTDGRKPPHRPGPGAPAWGLWLWEGNRRRRRACPEVFACDQDAHGVRVGSRSSFAVAARVAEVTVPAQGFGINWRSRIGIANAIVQIAERWRDRDQLAERRVRNEERASHVVSSEARRYSSNSDGQQPY